MLRRFLECEAGAVSVEYSLLIALALVIGTVGAITLGVSISNAFTTFASLI